MFLCFDISTPVIPVNVKYSGFREKNIAFIRVKVYAIGMYFDSDITTCLSSSWKSKKGADLYNDANLFKEILEGSRKMMSFGAHTHMVSQLFCSIFRIF